VGGALKNQKEKPSFLGLVSTLDACGPNTLTILGSPTLALAQVCQALGDSSAVLTSFLILDFIELHSCYLLFFCTLIIAQE
jgi:hypothetical protein